jgi:hypothetical protein
MATFVLMAYAILKFFIWLARRLAAIGFVQADKSVRLISLAIALLLFPSFIRDVFTYFSEAVTSFVYYTPQAISYSTSNVASACAGADGLQCFGRAWDIYLQFLQEALRAITSRLGGYSEGPPIEVGDLLRTAIYLLAIWILVGQLLVLIFNVQPMTKTLGDVRASLANRPAKLKNLSLFAMLGFASYLSFASIAAIPTLEREETPPEVNDTALGKLLEDSAHTVTVMLVADASPGLVEDAFDAESIRTAALGQGMTDVAFTDARVEATARNEELIRHAGELKTQLKDSLDTLQSIALSTYRTTNLKRIGARATIDHYQAMHGWFVREVSAIEQNLSGCHRAIFAYQRATIVSLSGKPSGGTGTGSQSYDMKQVAAQTAVYAQGLNGSGAGPGGFAEPDAAVQYQQAVDACAFHYVQEPPPLRGNLQNYVGSFGAAISWLLSTESQPLVLIVGLLGFGLLGAACSTFVREVSKKNTDGALVEDLAGVVIRGVSAAVVVFLAVYGGLAIFGTNAEPNPYVVLFTCLVGAVFSETVWDWAQKRLQENLARQDASGGAGGNAGGADPAAGAVPGKKGK